MAKQKIFAGMKHGHLTVVREVATDNWGIRRYECKCECGRKSILRSNHFVQSRKFCTRSCKLLSKKRVKDLTGRRFVRWVVLKSIGINQRTGWMMWRCQCDCGRRKNVAGAQLTAGDSRSCGCINADLKRAGRDKAQLLQARKDSHKKFRIANAAKIRANTLRYERKLSKATPDWLTEEHWQAMNKIYLEARQKTLKTGVQYDVDHIIPINGKTVSGLHVPWNLQILTKRANVRKSNRYAGLSGDR